MNSNEIFQNAIELTRTIKPREKAAFFSQCEKAENNQSVFEIAKALVAKRFPNLETELKKRVILNMYACGVSYHAMKKSETWTDYIISYTRFKSLTYTKLSDFGSFGDVVETICHLLVNRACWRVKIENLHVSKIGIVDLRFNGIKIEVGTNGKSWLESTPDDAMHGKFSAVVYGVFTEKEKESICNEFAHHNIKEAIGRIANNLYYFEDKYSFLDFMQSRVSRSETIVWKSNGYFQTVYNPSKDKAFRIAIKKENVPTFAETIGKNEFMK